jgi:hypothetical protein
MLTLAAPGAGTAAALARAPRESIHAARSDVDVVAVYIIWGKGAEYVLLPTIDRERQVKAHEERETE